MGDAVKNGVCGMIGLVGSLIASQFGGWDAALSTLVLFMAVDYVTGLVVSCQPQEQKRCVGISGRMERAVP